MELDFLNPSVGSVKIYERINRKDECVAYDYRLMYMISGDVAVTLSGKKLGHLTSGELLLIPPGTPYKLKGQYLSLAALAFTLTPEGDFPAPGNIAGFDRSRAARVEPPFDKVIRLSEMEMLREELCRMAELAVSCEGAYRAELSARLKLILLRIAETSDENALPARMVEALGEYIRENIGDEISNTEVAATFGYHPFYVSNVLKAAKGQTLRQYIISYRLKMARSMLECTSKSIAEISEECGFTDASYFTKIHRQYFGETPKEYRNRFKDEFI